MGNQKPVRIYKPQHSQQQKLLTRFRDLLAQAQPGQLAQIETMLSSIQDEEGNLASDIGPTGAYDPSDIRWVEKMFADPERAEEPEVGVFVRAKLPSEDDDRPKFADVDVAHLTKNSLNVWLRSRGGHNPYAETLVEVLLGHHEPND
jgi:hypothetical protein